MLNILEFSCVVGLCWFISLALKPGRVSSIWRYVRSEFANASKSDPVSEWDQ